MIPFLDLRRRLAQFEAEYLDAVSRVMRSGTLLLGDETARFEAEMGASLGGGHVVAVSSGAAAIQLTIEALGIIAGDEVIVPAFTAVPTVSAVVAAGARPVIVDVDAHTALIDVAGACDAVVERTKAIMPVHLYGAPVDAATLATTGVAVVEDAAQAHGAVRHSTSAATAFSFYPTKNLGGIGDGGAVWTSDIELADTVRRRRIHGMTPGYVHVDVSQNFRMSELEAAWLRLRLPSLATGNRRRAEIARHYHSVAPQLRWQADHADHVYHLCVARVSDRTRARSQLADDGVGTAVQYPVAITQQPAYRELASAPCPNAELWAAECMSVPCYPELTDAEVETVGDALQRVAP
ncbi:MAG TPA: DegT/DnrJ/EryC1/StrS family aminotransferase [Ilumatobacteraceae bacterium]|nr:DegT/DnrJ/EryC1/StrS family aminotransferase [Ilumatobacteraceae bacterium]